MTAVSNQEIVVEVHDKVGVLRLNTPARLNAVTVRMVEEMDEALNTLVGTVRALVLTGAGRAFCSGAALDGGLGAPGVDRLQRDVGLVLQTHINPLMSKLRDLPIPWITAVRGAAAGVGASFALAGDLVVASETAYFLQAFARIGLVPDGGSTHLLVRTIGRARAMELMLLGDRLPATKAMEWGLVNRVVPDVVLEEEALKLAAALAGGPSVALGLIRRSAWQAVDAGWHDVLRTEREMQIVAGRTLDFDEGIAAFNEKRAAKFTGA
jgi:2-(1,2-epoxy-1,2-dihydrophenyl)acetyl-CoA isomerase